MGNNETLNIYDIILFPRIGLGNTKYIVTRIRNGIVYYTDDVSDLTKSSVNLKENNTEFTILDKFPDICGRCIYSDCSNCKPTPMQKVNPLVWFKKFCKYRCQMDRESCKTCELYNEVKKYKERNQEIFIFSNIKFK